MHRSLARLEALAGDYQESANNGTLTEGGWLDDFMTNYATSKFFINGITLQENSFVVLTGSNVNIQ